MELGEIDKSATEHFVSVGSKPQARDGGRM